MVNSEQVNPGWINDVLYLSFFIVNLEYMGPNLPKKILKFLASEIFAGKGASQLFSWTYIMSEKILILRLLPPVF